MAATWGGAPPGFSLGGFSRICRLTITKALASEFTSPLILHRQQDMLMHLRHDSNCAGADMMSDVAGQPSTAGRLQPRKIMHCWPALAALCCRCAASLAAWTVPLLSQNLRNVHGSHKGRLGHSTVWVNA